jgi:hypothetical protein
MGADETSRFVVSTSPCLSGSLAQRVATLPISLEHCKEWGEGVRGASERGYWYLDGRGQWLGEVSLQPKAGLIAVYFSSTFSPQARAPSPCRTEIKGGCFSGQGGRTTGKASVEHIW